MGISQWRIHSSNRKELLKIKRVTRETSKNVFFLFAFLLNKATNKKSMIHVKGDTRKDSNLERMKNMSCNLTKYSHWFRYGF